MKLTFDDPSDKSVYIKGAISITIRTTVREKAHYTVVLAHCTTSTKLPPLLIFKRKTMFSAKIPQGNFIYIHPKGRMDENGTKMWLQKVWLECPGGLQCVTSSGHM
jgi:hypothetical protein